MMTEHNLEKGVVIEYYKLSVDSETNEEVSSIQFETGKVIKSAKWCQLPGIFTVLSDKDSQLFRQDSTDDQLQTFVPQWLQPPIGAQWAFGNKLNIFSQHQAGNISEYKFSYHKPQIKERLCKNPKP